MKSLELLILAASLFFATAALAQTEEQREMKIVVAGTSSDDFETFHWIHSGAAGFDMQGMQVGETQSIVDESGRSVLITRQEDGFKFDVDGKTIVIPHIGAHGDYLTQVEGTEFMPNFDVEIVGDRRNMPALAMPAFANGGVTIISGEPLDATTQESIKAVLQSAGRNDEVTFIDRSGDRDARHVKMYRKRVEVTQ